MVKTVELLGVLINDNYVREAMTQAILLERKAGIRIVEEIFAENLLECAANIHWRMWYRQMDLVLMGDLAIAETAGRPLLGRKREIQEHLFMREYLRYAQQTGKRVYLLTENFCEAAEMEKQLRQQFLGMQLVGVSVLKEGAQDNDGVANEINGALPDVIVSLLPMPLSMEFLKKEKKQLNAGIWLGMPKRREKGGLSAAWKKHMEKNKLARCISQYQEGDYADQKE